MHKQSIDDELTSVTELPYFEGDFWPNVIEEQIKELDKPVNILAIGKVGHLDVRIYISYVYIYCSCSCTVSLIN